MTEVESVFVGDDGNLFISAQANRPAVVGDDGNLFISAQANRPAVGQGAARRPVLQLPAWRVRVVRGGRLYPRRCIELAEMRAPDLETAPAAAKPPSEFVGAAPRGRPIIEAICPVATVAVKRRYGELLGITEKKTDRRKPWKAKGIIATAPDGRETRYCSIEAAAAATRVCTRAISQQCNGEEKRRRVAYRFRMAV